MRRLLIASFCALFIGCAAGSQRGYEAPVARRDELQFIHVRGDAGIGLIILVVAVVGAVITVVTTKEN